MKRHLFTSIFALCSVASYSQQPFYDVTVGNGNGIRLWQSDSYKIHMGNTSEYMFGPVTDYSIKMNSNVQPGKGWTWGLPGAVPVAALSNVGHMQIAGSFHTGPVIPDAWGTGRISVSGATAEFSLVNRDVSTFINSPTNGERWVIYNQGLPDGRLRFWSGGDKLTLTKDGFLGLGTTGPGGKLDINSAGNQIRLSGGAVAAGLWTNSADILYLADWSTGTKGLNINLSSGNVGIGTNSPTLGKLQVNQSSDASDQGIAVYNSTSVRAMRLWTDPNNSYVYSGATGQASLILNGTGNVGIGTTSPNQKLTVNGTIYGKEVKVDLNVPGPDYVFEEDYKLPSLDEIKSYIDANKHLPEVPSAKEMEANGINLSEMNMILLKKIEELTLHVIEQNKVIAKLQEQQKAKPDQAGRKMEDLMLMLTELKDENTKQNELIELLMKKNK